MDTETLTLLEIIDAADPETVETAILPALGIERDEAGAIDRAALKRRVRVYWPDHVRVRTRFTGDATYVFDD